MGRLRPAAFLDRDGTLNRRPPPHAYLTTPDAFEWLDGAREGAAGLAEAGYLLAVVSNQRGVARGLVTLETLRAIERRIQEDLRPLGAQIVAFRYCVHDLDAACTCRKPAPGMIHDLAGDLELDLGRSWMIGDSETDVATGRHAGCHTAIIGGDLPETKAEVAGSTLLDVSQRIRALTDLRAHPDRSRSHSETSAS